MAYYIDIRDGSGIPPPPKPQRAGFLNQPGLTVADVVNKKTSGYIETPGECKQSQRKVREYKRRNRCISDEHDVVNITTWDYFGAPEPLTGAGRFGSETFRII